MDKEEERLAYKLVRLAAIVASVAIMSASGCYIHSDYRIAQTIKNGADPIRTKIAFSSNYTATEMAVIYLGEKGQQK